MNSLMQTFDVYTCSAENLRDSFVVYATQVVKFCEASGFREISAILAVARNRIQHGAKNDVIPLMSLGCSQSIARSLFSAGITSKYDIEKCSLDKLISIISASQINSTISSVDCAKKLKQSAIRAITAEETLSQFEERSLHV
ncbi:hypothetical protein TVAG_016720 [Trichomonas vaginalis G3]|uniref:Uncharacterized protein n=1 Tax=Trichomonas vaginalis (strain ATCC PRA-98 / G3) TaxID=412133 RepID=A2ER10_TRIV3|nr:plastid DNA replication [Trichomonas vaginalis G3]EAY04900.1 hypothetical protein TVAG_016720 [Trichomonas vaginalis G3]KAI5519442.1 plastid DNA replication [Trichomonas vaginalis G3]|eukprot:XP_001317123.1 hypothetical protein [Trichomonas vaginalis G3]